MLPNLVSRIRKKLTDDHVVLELLLIGSTLALACLIASLNGNKMVVLNLFYLPVVLAGFFLGRYRAGVVALLCVIAASLAIAQKPEEFSGGQSTIIVGLATIVWGSVLCLTAIVVGSLSDERNAKVRELHEAYVGVVEVLSKYLRSANPKLKDRATRVAELCQKVAAEMNLGPREIDDIRVAALMLDLGKIEVTTRLVTRAVDTLESSAEPHDQHSFHGIDLVHSLGSVLKGAIPLLASQHDAVFGMPHLDAPGTLIDAPIGAKIIRVVREYDALTGSSFSQNLIAPKAALAQLDRDGIFAGTGQLRWALERAVMESRQTSREPDLALSL